MYYLVYGFLYLLSILPMWALYRLSDAIAFLLNHVFKYRYDVVLSNLKIAFPEKTDQERLAVARQFYKNFVDNFIETIKLISASDKFIQERFQFDQNVFKPRETSGEKLQLHLGHNFNWEMANVAVPFQTTIPWLVAYMPIKNKAIEKLFLKIRTRTGGVMLPATDMKNAMIPYRNRQYALALVADQVPGNVKRAHWMNFFGKPTPFVTGPEAGARLANMSVVFAQIYKTKRGFYRVSFTEQSKPIHEMEKGELTRTYVKFLEKTLKADPSMWLWSHRRWKHEWRDEYAKQWIDTAPVPGSEKL
jgi:KDO2-lipid IV(A) lauroyltransferase